MIKAIYTGEVLYTPQSAHSFIKDDYKPKAVIEVYDWRNRPFLDISRLRVPAIRSRLEFMTFTAILFLFLVTQLTHEEDRFKIWELLFIAWGIGFSLDEFASIQENGVGTYLYGAYNVMDALFCLDFYAYLGLRIAGWLSGSQEQAELAFDTLSLAVSLCRSHPPHSGLTVISTFSGMHPIPSTGDQLDARKRRPPRARSHDQGVRAFHVSGCGRVQWLLLHALLACPWILGDWTPRLAYVSFSCLAFHTL